MPEIVRTEDTLAGKPRLEDRRVGVLQVVDLVQETSPEYVADQLDLSLAEVHTALAYYYEHPDEMQRLRQQRRENEERLRETALDPPADLEH